MSQFASHGRGGAGNMVDPTKSPKIQPSDLETPTLKKAVVTTGRGGTGNMAKNTDPAETRLRQDVQGVPRRPSYGAQHSGRGGAGNVWKDKEVNAKADRQDTPPEQAIRDDEDSAISGEDGDKLEKAEKAAKKHWLFGKGKA
ncbi:uncharacterized protein F5Z01DRAFT_674933 [Emericellopsis atlantica]|uniref:Uncharacterized protein n=1 Tax=Emericellopsis atlantica TaxID=2614577 RepID=A0A9P7ZK84_9HYPO|nr:uncharacterized protein F5Z01DRAFT_674933 [Emericellopsis atlantica]KAG9253525.1 hypothetical protein F5Z01DRAFT_674933 [Emericellopsis atlantica]